MIRTDISKEQLVRELEILRKHTAELEEFKTEYQRRTRALLQIEEEERRSIAREIHNDISQSLTALRINLSWLERRIPKGEGSILEKLEQMLGLIDSITRAMKRISVELRPAVLDDLGLVAAIEWQAEDFREQTGIACELDEKLKDITLDGQIASAIFCILQKILKNISKKAGATSVRISLVKDNDKIHLKVMDNGEGTAEVQILDRQSFGLMEIDERAHLFGGEVKIRRNLDRGTTITVNIPLNQRGNNL